LDFKFSFLKRLVNYYLFHCLEINSRKSSRSSSGQFVCFCKSMQICLIFSKAYFTISFFSITSKYSWSVKGIILVPFLKIIYWPYFIYIDLTVKKKKSFFLNLATQSIMFFNAFGYFPFAVKSSRKLNKISSFNHVKVTVLGTYYR